jgi:hypothetical protein
MCNCCNNCLLYKNIEAYLNNCKGSTVITQIIHKIKIKINFSVIKLSRLSHTDIMNVVVWFYENQLCLSFISLQDSFAINFSNFLSILH